MTVRRLQARGQPIGKPWLRSLEDYGLPDERGEAPWSLTETSVDESGDGFDLGPVRFAGWRGNRRAPILHAKVAVLGHLSISEIDTDDRSYEWSGFIPSGASWAAPA